MESLTWKPSVRVLESHFGDAEAHLIVDYLTGRKFKVDEKTFSYFLTFKPDQDQDKCDIISDGLSCEEKSVALEFFKDKKLIYDGASSRLDFIHFYLPKNPIFGLPGINIAETPITNSMVLIGLPLGGASSRTIGCQRATSKIRSVVEGHKLNINVENATSLVDIFGLPSDFSYERLKSRIHKNIVYDAGDLKIYPFENVSIQFDKIYEAAKMCCSKGLVPFFWGGDHSISFSVLKAISEYCDSFYVLHIDAHADTYQSIQDIAFSDTTMHHHGNFMFHALNEMRQIKKVFNVGVRGINNFELPKFDERHEVVWSNRIDDLELPDDKPYYISFDIDALDPLIAPGTGEIVPNGLSMLDIANIFSSKLSNHEILGVDLVEFNPDLDQSNITAYAFIELQTILMNAGMGLFNYER